MRSYTLDDAEALHRVMADSRVHIYTKDRDHPSDAQRTENYIRFMLEKDFQTLDCYHGAVIEKCTNQLIGLCGLNPYLPKEPEIEFKLGVPWWNQGYATELGRQMIELAFAATEVRGIYGMARPDNAASRKVLEKLGMTYLGDRDFREHKDSFYYIARPR